MENYWQPQFTRVNQNCEDNTSRAKECNITHLCVDGALIVC